MLSISSSHLYNQFRPQTALSCNCDGVAEDCSGLARRVKGGEVTGI
jgi:hypothetical protein